MYGPDREVVPVLRVNEGPKLLPPGLTEKMVASAITAGKHYLGRPDATERGVVIAIWSAAQANRTKA